MSWIHFYTDVTLDLKLKSKFFCDTEFANSKNLTELLVFYVLLVYYVRANESKLILQV